MSDYTLVQLRLLPGTIQKVIELKDMLEVKSRTEAVKTAVYIAHDIVSALKRGEEVTIGGRPVLIPGLGKALAGA